MTTEEFQQVVLDRFDAFEKRIGRLSREIRCVDKKVTILGRNVRMDARDHEMFTELGVVHERPES